MKKIKTDPQNQTLADISPVTPPLPMPLPMEDTITGNEVSELLPPSVIETPPPDSDGVPDLVETLQDEVPPSRAQKLLKMAGWVSFGIFCLSLFTFLKLPNEKLKAYIDGSVSAALSDQGISYTAEESRLSLWFGVTYQLKKVTLYPPAPNPRIMLDEVTISPSLLSLLIKRYKAHIVVKDSKGDLDAHIAMRNTNWTVTFDSHSVDLGRFGILPWAAGIQGGGVLEGEGSISADTSDLSTTHGNLHLNFKKFIFDAQTLAGFPIPKIFISEGEADLQITNGKVQIKTFKIGKPTPGSLNGQDDLQGTITGQMTLGKELLTSKIDINTRFSLSPAVLKPLILLDAILGSGKQSDGSYAFHLTGPLLSPTPSPGEAAKE